MPGKRLSRKRVGILVTELTRGMWETPAANQPPNVFRLWDGWYFSPSEAQVRSLVKNVAPEVPAYHDEKFDCDDQAFFFRSMCSVWAVDHYWSDYGLCLGIARGTFKWVSGNHVTCWILYEGADGTTMEWIDPQLPKVGLPARQPLTEAREIGFLLV